jgi:phytoene dehydrogenase-like protein
MHTIIVGAGIAGLWIAEQLALRGDKVTILEKADYLGGRIITSKAHGVEIGAGRIATSHKRILKLIKRFGLQTIPLSKGELWKGLHTHEAIPNTFDATAVPILATLSALDARTLATHTLKQLLTKIMGPEVTQQFLLRFNYRAETETLRADLALQSFQHEMSSSTNFVVVKGGLSQLIQELANACRKAGVIIHTGCTVSDVSIDLYTARTSKGTFHGDRIILAIPVEALRTISSIKTLPLLRHLKMEPLTRIYAQTKAPWPFPIRIVTDSPLRYIIPINPAKGVVMISYTESQDTKAFRGLKGLALTTALQYEFHRLFPEQSPLQFKWAVAYEWDHGCTYWIPGTGSGPYSPEDESKEALQPFPGRRIHLCNESFSLRQAWMEGSLDHASALLDSINQDRTNS